MGRRKSKGRSYKTYQNKLRKLTKFYNLTFKHSEEQKKRNEDSGYKKPENRYFCVRYPNEKSYISTLKIKPTNEKK